MNHCFFSGATQERGWVGITNQTLSNILHAPHISGPTGCTLSKLEPMKQAVLLTDISSPKQILFTQNVSHVKPLEAFSALQNCAYYGSFFSCNIICKSTLPPSWNSWGFGLAPKRRDLWNWSFTNERCAQFNKGDENGGRNSLSV